MNVKIKNILVIILILITTSCTKQNAKTESLSETSNENIEKDDMQVKNYFSIKNWNELLEKSNSIDSLNLYNNPEKITSVKIYKQRNNQDKVLEYEEEWNNGKIIKSGYPNSDSNSYYQYYYDDQDRLIKSEMKYYHNDETFDALSFTYEYFYNHKDDTVTCKKTTFTGDKTIYYIEKISPNEISYEVKDISGSRFYTFIFNDDEISKIMFNSDSISSCDSFEYYENQTVQLNTINNVLKEKIIKDRFDKTSTIKYYDIFEDNEQLSSEEYCSDFDLYNNWTKKYNPEKNTYIYREFTYSE